VRCNRFIKFDALLDWARSAGAERIATGHYARTKQDTQSGRWLLERGRDKTKDQSYALYALTQSQLKHILFPTGELTKSETRQRAAELGLAVAGKRESQEICFVQGRNYTAYLEAAAPELVCPGPIVDIDGNVLGEHRGIAFYTIGQRKRLGVYAAQPLYVLKVDAETNTVVVGEGKYLYGTKLIAKNINLISLEKLPDGLAVTAKVRYNTRDSAAVVRALSADLIEVEFNEPQRAITPGQAVVLYQGDVVVGGGTIADAREAEEAYRSVGLAAQKGQVGGSCEPAHSCSWQEGKTNA
jgi:tRNA-specific 2-thiouridylase